MKIEKNKLVKVNYISEEFIRKLFIKNVDGLILDTIKVYGYTNNEKYKMEECLYSINKEDGNTITVTPEESTEGYYDKYILNATRLVNAYVIKFNGDDYLDIKDDMNGNFELVLNRENVRGLNL